MIRRLSHQLRDALRKMRKAMRQRFARPVHVSTAAVRGALAHVPSAKRAAFLESANAAQRSSLPPTAWETCEFHSLGEYRSSFARLATLLGSPSAGPADREIEFLAEVSSRPRKYGGVVQTSDYFFLTALASILAPPRVIEIGTLTGFSAAILAAALSRRHPHEGAVLVDTIDVATNCVIDQNRRTGFEIDEAFPDLARMINVHVPHDSSFVRQLAAPDELELVFIDDGHRHPQPLLDFLSLAPYVRSGGWMILHDIKLGTLNKPQVDAGQLAAADAPYGAEWLFELAPWRKISGGNIGAIQLPNDKSELIGFALRLVSLPDEIGRKGARRTRAAIYRALAALL